MRFKKSRLIGRFGNVNLSLSGINAYHEKKFIKSLKRSYKFTLLEILVENKKNSCRKQDRLLAFLFQRIYHLLATSVDRVTSTSSASSSLLLLRS